MLFWYIFTHTNQWPFQNSAIGIISLFGKIFIIICRILQRRCTSISAPNEQLYELFCSAPPPQSRAFEPSNTPFSFLDVHGCVALTSIFEVHVIPSCFLRHRRPVVGVHPVFGQSMLLFKAHLTPDFQLSRMIRVLLTTGNGNQRLASCVEANLREAAHQVLC